jgi:hypothetical protein
MSDRLKLPRIAARSTPRFIEIPHERGGGKVPFTEEQLTGLRGGLTAENIGGSRSESGVRNSHPPEAIKKEAPARGVRGFSGSPCVGELMVGIAHLISVILIQAPSALDVTRKRS